MSALFLDLTVSERSEVVMFRRPKRLIAAALLALARHDLDLAERADIARRVGARQAGERGIAVPADYDMVAAGRRLQAQRRAIHIDQALVRLPLIGRRM